MAWQNNKFRLNCSHLISRCGVNYYCRHFLWPELLENHYWFYCSGADSLKSSFRREYPLVSGSFFVGWIYNWFSLRHYTTHKIALKLMAKLRIICNTLIIQSLSQIAQKHYSDELNKISAEEEQLSLQINIDKTKVMVISRHPCQHPCVR